MMVRGILLTAKRIGSRGGRLIRVAAVCMAIVYGTADPAGADEIKIWDS